MTTTEKLTLEQFLEMEETEPASEYDDGEVCQKTMPSKDHAWIQRLLGFVFTLYLRVHPAAFAGSELRCTFSVAGRSRAYVPDYVFIRAERTSGWAGSESFRGAPDLAIEILSPDDRMSRVLRKIRRYLEGGSRQVWLIDPARRTVEVFTEPNVSHVFADEDTLDGGDVLPGFSVPVLDLLPPPSHARTRNRSNGNQ